MSSRNATTYDFEHVIGCIKNGEVKPEIYVTHRIPFNKVADEFETCLDPVNGVIKAMIEMP